MADKIKKPSDMNDEQLRIAVAEALGWEFQDRRPIRGWLSPSGEFRGGHGRNVLPNWPEDLNVCHEFEEGLTDIEFCRYTQILCGHTTPGERICWGGEDAWRACHATARQRCLAFLAATEKG